MTIGRHSHVQIDGIDFLVDTSQDTPYELIYQEAQAGESRIYGTDEIPPDEDVLLWEFTDWSQGEGNRIYDPEQPARYYYGTEVNPRIAGRLQGRPNRATRISLAHDQANQIDRVAPHMAVTENAIWLTQKSTIAYTSNGTSFTAKTQAQTFFDNGAGALANTGFVTSVATDGVWLYYAAYDYTLGTDLQERIVRRVKKSGNSQVVRALDVHASGGTHAPPFVIAMMGGYLYAWTGAVLNRIHVSASDYDGSAEATLTKVTGTRVRDDPEPNSETLFSDYWAGITASDNRLVFFHSTPGRSSVYHYSKSSQGLLWQAPIGLTIYDVCYSQGRFWLVGQFGGGTSGNLGWGCLYSIDTRTLTPKFETWIRKPNNSTIKIGRISPSYGHQLILTSYNDGLVFIYDPDSSGLSVLDDIDPSTDPDSATAITTLGCGSPVTWGSKRYIPLWDSDGSGNTSETQVIVYQDDEPAQVETGLNGTDWPNADRLLEVGQFDFERPYDKKDLVGFHVTFAPMVSGQDITITYSLDGAAFATAGTISDDATGRAFIQVSDNDALKAFINLSFRIVLASDTGVAAPVVYAVAAEARRIRRDKILDIIVRAKDEVAQNWTQVGGVDGGTIRDRIRTIVDTGEVISFKDGFRYSVDGKFAAAADVRIIAMRDMIQQPGEGSMWLRLKYVPS